MPAVQAPLARASARISTRPVDESVGSYELAPPDLQEWTCDGDISGDQAILALEFPAVLARRHSRVLLEQGVEGRLGSEAAVQRDVEHRPAVVAAQPAAGRVDAILVDVAREGLAEVGVDDL